MINIPWEDLFNDKNRQHHLCHGSASKTELCLARKDQPGNPDWLLIVEIDHIFPVNTAKLRPQYPPKIQYVQKAYR